MAQPIGEWINDNVIPPVLKFVNLRGITALKNGMMVVMPLTIIGSIFLLLGQLPIQPVADAFTAWGLTPVLMAVYAATFNMMGIVACLGIAYNYVKPSGYDALPAAVVAMCMQVLLMPTSAAYVDAATKKSVGTVADVLPMTWLGSKGMVGGIIIGLLTGLIYVWFLDKNITIKMPDGVPPNVATAFTSLIPGAVILSLGAVVFAIFKNVFKTTLLEGIYTAIQTPLQGLTDSLGGVILVGLLIPFLWWFGVHGASIVGGVLGPMLTANAVDNQKIIDSGKDLTVANGGHIVTQQFVDQFMTMTGSGVTIGMVIFMLFFAKSAQYKTLGKLGGGPAFFNINEPITFGTPIVMNPLLVLPFMLTPTLIGIIEYAAIAVGLAPLYKGVVIPWTTPPIISGFLVGDWRTALLQALCLVVSVVAYFPFMKKQDSMTYTEEQAVHAEHEAEHAA
jgi:cellobiose PTS system EIIC component